MKLVLPYPVSANRYWRTFAYRDKSSGKPKAVTAPSSEAKAYKEEAGLKAKVQGCRAPLAGPVEIRFRLVPANRICMDLDNALKVSIDALKGIVFKDDSQVYRIFAERGEPDARGARLEVEVLPMTLPTELDLPPAVAEPKRDPEALPF